MKFMKNIWLLSVMMLLFLCTFTTALLETGESFYEDFTSPADDLNLSNWGWFETPLTGASYSVSGGELYAIGGALSNSGSLILTNLDKNVNVKDNSFSVEIKMKATVVSSKYIWLQKHFEITDVNDDWSAETNEFYARVFSGGGSSDSFYVSERINGSAQTSTTGNIFSQLRETYKTYKWIKTDTNLEFILDNISQYNQTLYYTWNGENDLMPDNMTFFRLLGAQHNYVPLYIDYINITNLEYTGNPVQIEVISPEDETITNTKPNVVFNSTGVNGTLNCSLYLNDVLSLTNATVSLDTNTEFYLDLDVGDNDYYINCTDGTYMSTSGEFSIWYDPNDPYINLGSPLPFNTTVYDSYTMNILGNITNEELDYILVQLYDDDDVLFYENITTSFIDSTIFPFDWDFETNVTNNGVWDMYIYGNDTASNENELYLSFTINNCIPNWQCSDYGSCNSSDLSLCNETTDLNTCGLLYTGDLSEFSDQACDYCTPDWERDNQDCILHTKLINWVDLNEELCCNVTFLSSDCDNPYENSESCSIFQYNSQDIGKATIDTFVIILITIAGFGSILAILGLVHIFGIKSKGLK